MKFMNVDGIVVPCQGEPDNHKIGGQMTIFEKIGLNMLARRAIVK